MGPVLPQPHEAAEVIQILQRLAGGGGLREKWMGKGRLTASAVLEKPSSRNTVP